MFGKTMENVRQRIKVDLVTNCHIFEKKVCMPTFKGGQRITENLHVDQCHVSTVHLNKPIYCCFTVLELSKHLMYNFHYNHMKVKYPGDRLELLFTDTDSLAYVIETKNIYEDMVEDHYLYDFSAYHEGHQLYSSVNKKVLGKFKDELNGIPLEEFANLRPKCYSMKYNYSKEKKAVVGLKKVFVIKKLRHSHYLQCLESYQSIHAVQNNIVSKKHTVTTINQSNYISLRYKKIYTR